MSNDFIPAIAFVAMGAFFAAWIFAYRAIARAIRRRHPGRAAVIFGSPTRRKNGMDQFFALLGFLFGGEAARLGDGALRRNFALLKLFTALIVVSFLVMMISPMAIKLR